MTKLERKAVCKARTISRRKARNRKIVEYFLRWNEDCDRIMSCAQYQRDPVDITITELIGREV